MSGILIFEDKYQEQHIKVRWDIDVGCVTLTQCGEEVSISVDNLEETIEAMRRQEPVVRQRLNEAHDG